MAFRFDRDTFFGLCSYAAEGNLAKIQEIINLIPEKDVKLFDSSTFVWSPPVTEHDWLNRYTFNLGIFSPLHEAAFCGKINVVKYFFKNFSNVIDINAHANMTNITIAAKTLYPFDITLVMAACCSNSIDILDYLIKQGADLHRPTRVWGPPITIASKWGHFNAVKYLVERGASLNCSFDRRYNSPLLLACGSDRADIEVVKYLLDHGADITHRCLEGYTPVHKAALSGRLDIIKLLMKYGLNPTFVQRTSNSFDTSYVPCPLYLAAANNRSEVFDYLISRPTCPMICKGEGYVLKAIMPSLLSSYKKIEPDEVDLWIKGLEYIENSQVKPAYLPPVDEYNFHNEISSREELRTLLDHDYDNFVSFDIYFQSFMIVERCLNLSFASSTFDFPTTICMTVFRKMINVNVDVAEKLCQRAFDAFISRSKMFLRNPNYRGKDRLGLPTRVLQIVYLGIKKMLDDNQSIVNYSMYVKFSLKLLEMFDELYELADRKCDSKLVFNNKHHLGFFLLWLRHSTEVPKDFISLGVEQFSKYLYMPPGSSLIHQTISLISTEKVHFSPQILKTIAEFFFSWGSQAINYCDERGKRPIHLLMDMDTGTELKAILLSNMITNGLHIDAVDGNGRSVFDYITEQPDDIKKIISSCGPLSLSCCTARFITKEWESFKDHVFFLPKHIVAFIELHK